jgi:hypothetical protein
MSFITHLQASRLESKNLFLILRTTCSAATKLPGMGPTRRRLTCHGSHTLLAVPSPPRSLGKFRLQSAHTWSSAHGRSFPRLAACPPAHLHLSQTQPHREISNSNSTARLPLRLQGRARARAGCRLQEWRWRPPPRSTSPTAASSPPCPGGAAARPATSSACSSHARRL